ncbi:hypothetical protein [Nostoc sp. LEGE 12450]|nr:hypothetical protein [Nostoc sp. LEGE 12450]
MNNQHLYHRFHSCQILLETSDRFNSEIHVSFITSPISDRC